MGYAARSCIGKRCNTYMHIPIKICVTFSNCMVSETLNLISGVNEKTDTFLPPANEVWGKVIFSEACVNNSVHRGGVCLSACWDTTTPGSRHPSKTRHPRSRPPQEQTPLDQAHPRSRHPHWRRACWEIRSMRGRYASY